MIEGWDQSKFDMTLNEYLLTTSKSMPEAINQKAFFIARKALWFTKKVEKTTIQSELGRTVFVERTTSTGRTVRRRHLELATSRGGKISLARMILSKRIRKKGGQWPKTESEWTKRIRDLLNARQRSTAFLKAGWLPAIKILGAMVTQKSGAAPTDSAAKQFGPPKGSASWAYTGNLVATIVNSAIARHDKKDALQRYGSKALDTAFYDETQSMIEYLEQKMMKATMKANEGFS